MAYNLSWYVENRVMLIQVIGDITVDEYEQLHDESFEYVTNSQHKVHAIVDLSQFKAIPSNIRVLFTASNHEKDERQGMTVMVMKGMPSPIRFVVSLIMQTLRLEYRVTDTIDEAMKIVRRVDVDVPADVPKPI